MPKQALENLTESMFYPLMALTRGDACGAEITAGRLKGSVPAGAPSAPGAEEADLYAAAGWEFVCSWQEFFFYRKIPIRKPTRRR